MAKHFASILIIVLAVPLFAFGVQSARATCYQVTTDNCVRIARGDGGGSPYCDTGSSISYSTTKPPAQAGFCPSLPPCGPPNSTPGVSYTIVSDSFCGALAANENVVPINFSFSDSGATAGSGLIMNTGQAGSSMNVTCISSQPWLVVTSCPAGPYVAGQPSASQPFTVSVNTAYPSVAPAGTYYAHLTISAAPGSGTNSVNNVPQIVYIDYTSSGAPPPVGPTLDSSWNPLSKLTTISVSGPTGSPVSATVYVRNTGPAASTLYWNCKLKPGFTLPAGVSLDTSACNGSNLGGGAPPF